MHQLRAMSQKTQLLNNLKTDIVEHWIPIFDMVRGLLKKTPNFV
jgi:hypothetical protein